MRRPPPLQRIWEFPVSGGTCLLAIAVSLAGWSGKIDPDSLMMGYRAWHDQPWRLVTGIFYHVNGFHLMFDVYWTWVFGAIVEEAYQHAVALDPTSDDYRRAVTSVEKPED